MEAEPLKATGMSRMVSWELPPRHHFTGLLLALDHRESEAQSPVTLTVIVLLHPSFDPLTLSSPGLAFPGPEDKLIVFQGCCDPVTPGRK